MAFADLLITDLHADKADLLQAYWVKSVGVWLASADLSTADLHADEADLSQADWMKFVGVWIGVR